MSGAPGGRDAGGRPAGDGDMWQQHVARATPDHACTLQYWGSSLRPGVLMHLMPLLLLLSGLWCRLHWQRYLPPPQHCLALLLCLAACMFAKPTSAFSNEL